jgi:2-polyprenyl-3-methyl-5-hydroxy-6-metoxy-1,4-benzoquinol methylase
MQNKITVFDIDSYNRINEARGKWLNKALDDIPICDSLKTALDVACGAGYFSKVLARRGLETTGIDLRSNNIETCKERYPELHFYQMNLDEEFDEPGSFDLVPMFGVLYHLQSPLKSILRLAASIGRVGIVETRVAPGNSMACYLFEELLGDCHNTAPVTEVPTLAAIVGIFRHAGFEYIYRPTYQPEHEEWEQLKNGQRHCFIVSREAINVPLWQRMTIPKFNKKWEPVLVPKYI